MGNVLFLAFFPFFYVNGKINANVSSLTDGGYKIHLSGRICGSDKFSTEVHANDGKRKGG
jgi:hypothetical protein